MFILLYINFCSLLHILKHKFLHYHSLLYTANIILSLSLYLAYKMGYHFIVSLYPLHCIILRTLLGSTHCFPIWCEFIHYFSSHVYRDCLWSQCTPPAQHTMDAANFFVSWPTALWAWYGIVQFVYLISASEDSFLWLTSCIFYMWTLCIPHYCRKNRNRCVLIFCSLLRS